VTNEEAVKRGLEEKAKEFFKNRREPIREDPTSCGLKGEVGLPAKQR
jgi:hypothetical protein